jgi:hypothetical protein
MVRRLSALFFLAGMITLLLFQQPVFAYCAHTNQLFIDDCGCEDQVESQCSHCQQEQPADPCDDCSEKIQLDVDDLVWFDLAIDSPKIVCSSIVDGPAESIDFLASSVFAVSPTRPPPPPPEASLLLLYSVFRL